jgi:nitrate reductase NapD
VLVHARPEYITAVCLAVSMLPKAAVTHQTDDGRAVVVLEAGSSREVAQQLDGIRSLRGVLNVAPVYQHAEADDEMSKEMDA